MTTRPLTYMLPANPVPTRTLIVSDPKKLTYFAEANAVRMGLRRTAGAFSGLGAGEVPDQQVASADSTLAASGGQTVGTFLRSLLDGLVKPTTVNVESTSVERPPPADNTFLGLPPAVAVVGGLVLVGGAAYLLMKKKR